MACCRGENSQLVARSQSGFLLGIKIDNSVPGPKEIAQSSGREGVTPFKIVSLKIVVSSSDGVKVVLYEHRSDTRMADLLMSPNILRPIDQLGLFGAWPDP